TLQREGRETPTRAPVRRIQSEPTAKTHPTDAYRDADEEVYMATVTEPTIEPTIELAVPAPRNPGMPLDLARVAAVAVNRSAVDRRAATLPTRRTVKKEWQAAWLLRAITCLDLTTLSGDDTPGAV